MDALAEYGLTPVSLVVALVAVIGVAFFFFSGGIGGSSGPPELEIELHPEHVKYMKIKEEEYCAGNFGKGLRCIIDFLREESGEQVKTIFAEKPKYTDGFEKHPIDIHPQQFEWLGEKGIEVSTVEGEEYKELGRISRACLDWAMRQEAEGNNRDQTLYELIRCLNC
mmetsp:Transcript_23036/g.26286  ORF Transcript_23036/g.26286 Transcript_23036/m.26286 type:complete len:167 (+) Transcript_23036:134-634(+)